MLDIFSQTEWLQEKTNVQVVFRALVPEGGLPWHFELEKVDLFGQKQLSTREQGTGPPKSSEVWVPLCST